MLRGFAKTETWLPEPGSWNEAAGDAFRRPFCDRAGELWIGQRMDRDRLLRSLDKAFFDLWPLIVCGAAAAQFGCGETGRCDVFTVDDHQFFALLFVEKMHETDGHHFGGQLVAVGLQEGVDMF